MRGSVPSNLLSQVQAARDGAEAETRAVLEALIETYWHPAFLFIRQRGYGAEEAQDLTQAFFTEFLEKRLILRVDPQKGGIRTFLKAALRNFLSHDRERRFAKKRGGMAFTNSLELGAGEERYGLCLADRQTPEDTFECRWAGRVLDGAIERLRQESRDAPRDNHFESLRCYLTGKEPVIPYREMAKQIGISEGAVRVAVHRQRKRCGRCLRAELADRVPDAADIDGELRHLLTCLRDNSST